MNTPIPEIESDPKSAPASYIRELEEYYYPWYDSATTRNFYLWNTAQAIALLAGFATAILAALLKDDSFQSWPFSRILLIVVPILGSLASTFLVQSRIADLEALRERGRQGIQRLVAEARVDYASASTPQRFSEIHRSLITEVSSLEQEQARGFHSIVPKLLTFRKGGA